MQFALHIHYNLGYFTAQGPIFKNTGTFCETVSFFFFIAGFIVASSIDARGPKRYGDWVYSLLATPTVKQSLCLALLSSHPFSLTGPFRCLVFPHGGWEWDAFLAVSQRTWPDESALLSSLPAHKAREDCPPPSRPFPSRRPRHPVVAETSSGADPRAL